MWTFGRRIAAGFAVAFALLAVVGFAGYRSIDSLTKTSYLVAHTHQVMEKIAGVLKQLTDAETGQRGFVITGDDAFLEPYQTGTASVTPVVKDLRTLTADNRSQQQRLDEVEPLVASRLVELKSSSTCVGAEASSPR